MLCCFPVDEGIELLLFLAVEGVFAGVRAEALDFSPILAETGSIGQIDKKLSDRTQAPTMKHGTWCAPEGSHEKKKAKM